MKTFVMQLVVLLCFCSVPLIEAQTKSTPPTVSMTSAMPPPFKNATNPVMSSTPKSTRMSTKPTTSQNQTTKMKMGMKKGVMVGLDVGAEMSFKGYANTWLKRVCDAIGGMFWGNSGQSGNGQGWGAQGGMGQGGSPGGMSSVFDAQVGMGQGGPGGQGGQDPNATFDGTGFDISVFGGAERVLPVSLLLLLLGIWSHALF